MSFVSGRFALAMVVFLTALPVAAQDMLRVGTIERKPFAFQVQGEWTGFTIELMRQIAELTDSELEFVSNEAFGDMLSGVVDGTVDMAAANISVTSQREAVMDFSRPIFDSGLMVLAAPSQQGSVFSAFLKPQILMWIGGAILLFMGAGWLIGWLERRHALLKDLPSRKRWDEGVWWSVSVVTNASFTIFTPMTAAGRALSYVLILVGLFVVSAFVAQITAALTVQELNAQITGLSDLDNKRVGTTEGSTSERYLQTAGISPTTYISIDDLFDAIETGEVDALVHDAPILAYYAQTRGKGRFETIGRLFKPEKYGIALPQGSMRTEELNRAILSLKEDGTYDELIARWFGASYQ